MTEKMKILVVEDDDDQFQTYSDSAEEIGNAELGIELIRKNSHTEAKEALLSNDFDGAIVDLNLDPSSPGDSSGNEVLQEIVGTHRFPVFVVSGHLDMLNEDLKERKSVFFDFFDRDTPNDELFGKIFEIYNTGITQILGGRGKIEKMIGEIFWKHFAIDFDVWTSVKVKMERPLIRHTMSHLAEYLDIPDGENRFYHEAEFYIKPPVREYIASGDVIEKENTRFIVLSPSCDIAVRDVVEGKPVINAACITIAPLIQISRESFIENSIINEGFNSSQRRSVLDGIMKGQRPKYIFLPAHKDLYASIIDLQNISSVTIDNFLEYHRIATISGIFFKDIQSKFSAYYGRQGQPDMNPNMLISKCMSLISPPK